MSISQKRRLDRRPAARSTARPNVSEETALLVWIRAAGVCAFPGCGEVLHRDPTLMKPRKLGELAHNVAAQPAGPRGDKRRSPLLADDPENLVLLCPTHHKRVDKKKGAGYPEHILRQWKQDHERNVEFAATFTSGKKAVPIIVEGPIGDQVIGIDVSAVAGALLEAGLAPAIPAQRIELPGGIAQQGSDAWWQAHLHRIRDDVARIMRMDGVGNYPLAVYPLGEMPPLIAMGHLLGDKREVLPFQYRRDTASWTFSAPGEAAPTFDFNEPQTGPPEIALTLSLTANIDAERVYTALGRRDVQIINFTTPNPSTGLVRNLECIECFRQTIRRCLDSIERAIGRPDGTVHVFPAMPAPLAVAFGTTINEKTTPQLRVYDARGAGGAFNPAVTLPLRS